MGGRDSLDGFLDDSPYSSLQSYDFISAFLHRIERENRERNHRILSMTGGSTASKTEPAPWIPNIRERYSPPRKTYTHQELERILRPPFSAKAHAEKVYQGVSTYVSNSNSTNDLRKRLDYADKVLDALHFERGLFNELKNFSMNARILYGHHVPEIDMQIKRISTDIPRYLEVRQNIVSAIIALKQQYLPLPKKP
jgi:hypothetical protein